jgi:hypothetical protein
VTYGLPAPWVPQYREILRERHCIELRAIAGCVVTRPLLDYAASYNEVMAERITDRFGEQVFETAMEEAKKREEDDRP